MPALQSTVVGGILVVQFNDTEISDTRAKEVGEELLDQIGKANDGKLLLDLKSVEYFSSAMLGQVFWLNNMCKAEKVRLRVCNVEPQLKAILDVVGFEQVVELLDDVAHAQLAFAHDQSLSFDLREEDAAEAYLNDVEAGDAEAQYQLARCYDEGRGVEQSADDAFDWYVKAAEQGHPDAQYNVGRSHSFGIHVPQDYDQALAWYRRAADKGHPDAQYILGVSHRWGIGVPEDSEGALHWYRQAADQGHQASADALSEMEAD